MTRRSPRAGSALIEFAGSLILLSAVFAGVFQIGYTFYTYNALVNSVRAGARYASMQPRETGSDPAVGKAVRNLVVYGDPAPRADAKPVSPGLTTEHVQLEMEPASSTVSLRGFEIDTVFAKVKLDGKPTVTFPAAQGAAR
jgi:Flp pilus assembly protein TadG